MWNKYFMRKLFSILLVLILMSCLDEDFANEDLCTEVFCGEILDDKVNLAVYNNTSLDFDEFTWSIGGQVDTVYVLANNQFSCWINLDSMHAKYVYAEGVSEEIAYTSDTVYLNNELASKTVFAGSYKLDIIRNQSNQKLTFSLFEGYEGDCIYF
jgi:hypothetical protein